MALQLEALNVVPYDQLIIGFLLSVGNLGDNAKAIGIF